MSDLRSQAIAVARRLSGAGHIAYFAGGCVRDALLGAEPKDYDIATDATPAQVLKLFPGSHDIGAHFGVILVKAGGFPFEIATFRTDGSYRDGRRPETVEFSTPEEDAKRRDFTINGLFQDPETGGIIDFTNGQEDLRAGVLRAIGDPAARFAEDHLRLLRAVRFAAALGFEIEPATWSALCAAAPTLRHIAVERVREEFLRIMLHPSRVRGFDLLDASGLLREILPEMEALKGCTQPPEWHPEGDVWVHTRLMLSLLPEKVSAPLVLSVLLHDIGKPATWTCDPAEGRIRFNGHDALGAEMADAILHRLKFPNDIIDAAVSGVAHHMHFMHVQSMRTAKLKRFMARPTFDDELELHRVDCLGSNGFTDNHEFLTAKRGEFSQAPVIPPRLLTGHDLILAGRPSGPELGKILTAVQDMQLEGVLTTKEQALEWVAREF